MLSSQPLLKPIMGGFLTSLYGITWIVTSTLAITITETTLLTKESIAQPLPAVPTPNAPVPVFTPPSTFSPNSGLLPQGYTPPPFSADPSNQFNRYRLGIGDAIAVTVPRFPEFNFQGAVSPQGDIIVPLVGRVSVVGLTLEETESKVSYLLGTQFLRTPPDVIATLAAARPVQVTIAGEVVRPGYYPLTPGSQLTAALLAAGGATQKADLRSIIVRRPLIDGSVLEQKVDLLTPLQNGTQLPELLLQDGDAVMVDQINVATEKDYDRRLVSQSTLAQPQIAVRVLSYPNNGIGTITLANGSNFIDALTAIAPNPDAADISDIALIRYDAEQGKAVTQVINGKRALMGDIAQNVPLQNNDVIVIGRTLVAKITYALNIFTQPFRDVLGFLLFFDSLSESADNLFAPGSGSD